ncbi:hypothetical protein GY45DRAFT_1259699 [Cubamyces sp. BRFM 1775]|nr:hypothetical protein GY45DRAFT_1259699 [Cubamyces sp. BRFM 1775]
MTFVAPAPRIPLADVLRHLDASWPSPGRSPVTPTPLRAHRHGDPHGIDATLASPRDGELPQLGLGLMMGAACVPIQLPRARLERGSESQSQTRYSRRLRHLAPAPLQLASPTPRAPFRTPTQTHTPLSAPVRTTTSTSADFTEIPLATTQRAPALDNVSVSPQSDRKASVSSTMDTQSTAPTSLAFPECSENVWPNKGTSVFSWQRAALSQPLSPLSSKYALAGPSNAAGRAMRSPRTPSRRSSLEYANPFTPGLPPESDPPPLRRSEWVPLPELHDDMNVEAEMGMGMQPSPSILVLSPLRADLRGDLGVEDLQMRAEVCSETIARASMPLRSCSVLRAPESIADLCNRLRDAFASVQRALDGTPDDFAIDWSETKRTWYAKHWQVISSLDRNLNMFYLLAHQVEDRPPRIHRLAPILDKLSTYQAKFADLARRIVLSHEKLRFLSLRDQLSVAHSSARHPFDFQRNGLSGMLRHDARAARQEGRARRREIREELTRVRGRIRAIRERGLDPTGRTEDENAMPRNEDEDDDMIDDKTGDARGWW